MKNKNILITVKKELRSIFRDKKTLGMILGFPFVIALFIFFFGFMEDSLMGSGDTKYNIALDYEISEVEESLFEQYSLVPKYYEDVVSMKLAYDEGKVDAYVTYDETEKNYVVYSDSDINGMNISSFVMAYLDDYNRYLGDLYLIQNDVDPAVVYNNLTYEVKDIGGEEISTSGYMIDIIMSISFTYIVMAIALAAVNMATSAIAVEKEHGTLETILTLPVTTSELIIGKYIATVVIGAVSSIIGFALTIVSFAIARGMFESYADFSINFGAIFWGIVICIVASLLIGGLAIAVTSSAKSYKEAQASGQVLSLLCVVPMFMTYLNIDINSLYYLIPILNYTTILMDLYSNSLNYLNLLLTMGSTIVYVGITLFFLIKKFRSEKVLFGA